MIAALLLLSGAPALAQAPAQTMEMIPGVHPIDTLEVALVKIAGQHGEDDGPQT